jgi:glycosyltransferase involved in cell wall biosynthesis
VSEQPDLSVIVPFYNEEDNIRRMHAAIVAAIEPLGVPFEMVLVNDGSKDRTLELATEIAREDPRVRVVNFRRNYGQTPAMAAGIEQAHGKVLITMDGDLQNDPRDIEHFLAKINEGYDIVVGWRFNRQDKLVSRKIPSKIANWLIGKVTGVPIKDNGCSLKAFRASLIKEIPLYSEMHRFIPAMASIAGPRDRGDQGAAPRAPVRPVEVRPVARVQGAARPDGDQDRGVVHVPAAAVVRDCCRCRCWLIGSFALGYALWDWAGTGGMLSLPIAGTGIVLLIGAMILVSGGVLGELVYKLGDVRESDFHA